MPVIEGSSYRSRPYYYFNAHMETILPSMFGKGPEVNFKRERFELADGDFLDIDFLLNGNSKCMVITHGLEGGSDRYYVRRTAKYFADLGWDVIAWNCRSCSGELNRLPRFYHHGETEDLATVINLSLKKGYDSVVLLGYSMGGSMTIKYLGERQLDSRVKGAMTFSVPCNLRDSSDRLRERGNRIYEKRFIRKLVDKIRRKAAMFPGSIDINGLDKVTDFDVFHERYTAPLHGFSSVDEFFQKSTCDQFISTISVPVLVANAANDPMLGDACYPYDIASKSEKVYLEVPKVGGHTGFILPGKWYSWMEVRAEQFLKDTIKI